MSLASQVSESLPSKLRIEKECLHRIVDSGNMLMYLMDNLLDYSSIISQTLPLQNVQFSLVDEVNTKAFNILICGLETNGNPLWKTVQ